MADTEEAKDIHVTHYFLNTEENDGGPGNFWFVTPFLCFLTDLWSFEKNHFKK